MNRTSFMTVASLVALAVGTVATAFPQVLLASKGVDLSPPVIVWVRQVGVLLLAVGGMAFGMRRHPDSPTLRVFLLGNGVHQLMLAPIEVLAFRDGTITRLSGIVPNTVLHVLLATAFFGFGLRMLRAPVVTPGAPAPLEP